MIIDVSDMDPAMPSRTHQLVIAIVVVVVFVVLSKKMM